MFYVVFCIAHFVVYYLNVSCSELIISVGEGRAVFLLSITRKIVVSVQRRFLFLYVLRIGYVIFTVALHRFKSRTMKFYGLIRD